VQRSYFDHNATTPVAPEVVEAMVSCLRQTYGNASSIHHFGQAAKQVLEGARRQVAGLIHCQPAEIVFTSGGTESDNLAVLGAVRAARSGEAARERKHAITSAIEHPAVLAACAQLEREGVEMTRLPVGSSGIVNPDDLRRALRPDTVLVSIMHANNEIGTLQPIAEMARITRAAGVCLHADGVQALGKVPVDMEALGVDLYSMSGHKICAPKGVGVLFVRKGTRLAPIQFGGHHERDRRPGTENVAGAVAFGRAAELAAGSLAADADRLAFLRDRLENGILAGTAGATVNGSRWHRTPNTSNICFDGIEGEAMVIALDLRGFAVSTGSACSSGSVEPSHVLLSLGMPAPQARSSLRFSLGRENTTAEVDALIQAVADSVRHLRRISVHA
jgi:cysteine desulfurase